MLGNGSQKSEGRALFKLKVRLGIIVFLTVSLAVQSKEGIQKAPLNLVADGEGSCLLHPHHPI